MNMVKTSLIETASNKKETVFPIIMEYIPRESDNRKIIVHFTDPKTGTCLFDSANEHALLQQFNYWTNATNKEHWKPFTGKIVFENVN
jgi:hypothetical protein